MTTGAEQECNCGDSQVEKQSRNKDLGRWAHLHFAWKREKRDAKRANVPSLVRRQDVGHGQLLDLSGCDQRIKLWANYRQLQMAHYIRLR